MGDPVRIQDVAERFATQAQPPIEIVYTGLRPGEKLHEDLISTDEIAIQRVHPLIAHVQVPPLGFETAATRASDVDTVDARLLSAVCGIGLAPSGQWMRPVTGTS
jgi:FlaA1/EpsC-like NDP-sugar epimerase